MSRSSRDASGVTSGSVSTSTVTPSFAATGFICGTPSTPAGFTYCQNRRAAYLCRHHERVLARSYLRNSVLTWRPCTIIPAYQVRAT